MNTLARTMLEREQALAALDEALDAALAGSGRVALVFGEAGIGKTTLVRSFTQEASRNARVVSGACEALFTPRPLGPVHDIARKAGGPLLDALADADRVTILAALLMELGGSPTVAVFEDLHWADEATLDAIAFLSRRLENTPCLLVATHRDDELGPQHPMRRVIGELPSRLTVRVPLAPLSQDAVTELAREAGRSARGLHAATGGNPFYVTEVLAADEGAIPATVRDAVLARAGRLTASGRRLLEAAAVVPGEAELWLVERLAPAAPRRVSRVRSAHSHGERRRVPPRAYEGRDRGRAQPQSPDRAEPSRPSRRRRSTDRRSRPRRARAPRRGGG